MMPLYLEMKGFGPYLEKQTVDFARLRKAGLFLIYGVTGAGKTAILDAMTYALYGSSSGGQRGGFGEMRCQLCDPADPTLVKFILEHKGVAYGFQRELKAKRTQGYHETILCGRMVGEDIQPFAANIGVKNAAKYAEALFGLTADQFRQVIILPQGKFEKLLTAGTAEKEAILSTLFGTEIWNRTAALIRERDLEQRRMLKSREEHLEMMLNKLETDSFDQLSVILEERRQEADGYNAALSRAARELEHLQTAEERGRLLADIFSSLDASKRTLDELEQKQPYMDKLEETVSLGERAAKLLPSIRERARAEAELTKRIEEAEQASKDKEASEAAFQDCERQHKRIPEMEQNASQLEQKRERLQADARILGQMQEAEEEMAQLTQAMHKLSQEQSALDLDRLERNRQELAAKREQLFQNYVAKEDSARQKLRNMETADKLWRDMRQAERDGKELRIKWQNGRQTAEAAKAEAEAAKLAYDRGYARHFQNMAAVLREKLKEGEPCPVCGSREHNIQGEESCAQGSSVDLERLRRELDQKLEQAGRAEREYARLDEQLKSAQQAYKLQRESLRAFVDQGEYSEGMLEQARAEVRQCEKGSLAYKKTEQQIADADRQYEAMSERKEKLKLEISELEKNLATKRERINIQREGLTVQQDKKELTKTIAETERILKAERARIEQVKTDYLERSAKLAAARSRQEQSRAEQEKAALGLKEAEQRLIGDLGRAGFLDRAQAEKYMLDDAVLAERRKEIERYRQSLELEQENAKNLSEKLAGRQRPDMELLTGRRTAAKEDYEKKLAEANRCVARLETFERDYQAAKQVYEMICEQKPAADRLSSFSGLLSGNVKVSLGRYVMGVMLSAVTAEANKLLQNVHGGRYQIFRAKGDREKQSGKTGLAIEVYDGYSGGARGTTSLSGGEKFLVSMALSLGLAAVMQAISGGIAIDSMFIDEGFGTLDEASINDALDMLATVKQSGRMVGIISHVGGLRETISCGLEVKKLDGGRGSRVKLHE